MEKLRISAKEILKLIADNHETDAEEKILSFQGDKDNTRFTLIRTLISYAQINRKYDVVNTALNAFERIKAKAPKDKSLYYDIANGYQTLFELTVTTDYYKAFECEKIIKKAIHYFEKALGSKPNVYTNFGNLYDYIGRPVEAIDYYEKALKLDKDFGMALGNIALALESLAPVSRYSNVYLIYAYQLYQSALKNEKSIKENAGIEAINTFRKSADQIVLAFKKHGKEKLLAKNLAHKHYDESSFTPFVKFYTEFCTENNLYINLHRSDKASEGSVEDSLFPILLTGNDEDEKKYVEDIAFRFNEISEAYMTARMALVQSQYPNPDFSAISNQTILVNNLDYSASNIYVGHLKTAYKEACSALDKIAILLNHYLKLGHSEDHVYYHTVWFEPQPEDSKEDPVLSQKVKGEPWLLGLFLLCQEFRGSRSSQLRNALTHKYVRVYRTIDGPKGTYSFEEMTEITIDVFYKVRCAIMYLSLFISRKELSKKKDAKGMILDMPLYTGQDLDIWEKS